MNNRKPSEQTLTDLSDSPAGRELYKLMLKSDTCINLGAMRVLDDMGTNRFGRFRLGALVAALESFPDPETPLLLAIPGEPGVQAEVCSYRGYYEDLCLLLTPPGTQKASVGRVRQTLREAIGRSFPGYKGGTYRMHDQTRVWVGNYGCGGGSLILGVDSEDTFPQLVVGPENWEPFVAMPALDDVQRLHRDELARATQTGWKEAMQAAQSVIFDHYRDQKGKTISREKLLRTIQQLLNPLEETDPS